MSTQQDELSKLFEEFDRYRRTEDDQESADKARRDKVREQSAVILRNVALPVLQAMATEIARLGHETEIIERLAGSIDPSVSLHLTLKGKPHTYAHASTLMLDSRGGNINARIEVTNQSGRVSGPDSAVRMDEIDEAWVRKLCVGFVRSVLSAN